MSGPENPQAPEAETSRQYGAVFVLPSYPFPQKPIKGFSLEGSVERLVGRHHRESKKSGLLFDTHLKNLAAAYLVRKGEANIVVTMTRPIRTWMKKSYASLMADDIRSQLRADDPPVTIIQEEQSHDLVSEVEAIQKISSEQQFAKVAIITDEEHAKRTRQIIEEKFSKDFPRYEIRCLEPILTDETYTGKERSKSYARILRKLHNSPFWKFWIARERFLRSLPKGLTSSLARRSRPEND